MTKVDIISGFLGAGKTTFIKKLIEDVFPGERLVLIENEFGEIGIDGGFLKDAGVEITEMNSGCICCTLVGDFSKALQKVLEDYTPDRVIIEPSGVGKLSDVVKAIEGVKDEADIEIDGRITVVDGKKAKIYLKNFGEFFNNQVEHASTIVISRTQMMTDEKVEECVHMLREKNAEATIISTPWEELGKDAVLHALQHGAEIEGILEEHAHEHDDHEHHHHHDDECGCGHDHDHDQAYEEGLISGILTTNLIYQTPELLSRPYYINCDMSKYIALVIDTLNHDASISSILDPSERIQHVVEKYKKGEAID